MAIESAEDLLRFFDLDHFGTAFSVGGVSKLGIFENCAAEASGITGTRPTLTCRSSDVSAVVRGTDIVIGSKTYDAVTVKNDGTGFSVISLQEA